MTDDSCKQGSLPKLESIPDSCVPAVNDHGGFGRCAFVEIADPWGAKDEIRGTITADGAW